MTEFIINYWVQVLFSVLIAITTALATRVIAIKKGTQALLRNEIIKSYNYYKEKGYCPVWQKDNICNMYNQYHKLGANGVVDGMVKYIVDMPTNKKGEEE